MSQYHDILGVQVGSSPDEIKKSYRKLALQYHPDRGGDEEKFKEITEAYNVLSGKTPPSRSSNSGFGGFDLRDIFEKMGFGGGRSSPGMGFGASQRPPDRDSEVGVRLQTSVARIRAGGQYTHNYVLAEKCTDCQGVGGEHKTMCRNCNGVGNVSDPQVMAENRFVMYLSPCAPCQGRGIIFTNPCKTCNTEGIILKKKNITFEIKEVK